MPKNQNKIEARKKAVLEAKLKSPQATTRQIAEAVGSSKSTIALDIEAIGQDGTKDDIPVINAIRDADLEIVTLGQSLILDKMKDKEEQKKMAIRDISAVAKDSQVRYSFLTGENANKDGGEKEKIFFLPEND